MEEKRLDVSVCGGGLCLPDKGPGTPDDIDEDADAGRVLGVTVDGVSDKDGGDDLVSDSGDGDADLFCIYISEMKQESWWYIAPTHDRRDVPMSLCSLLEATSKHDQSHDTQ